MHNFQKMTQEWQANGKCQIHIGYTDLARDVEGIQNLLRLSDEKGVLLQTWNPTRGEIQVYRPTTNVATKKEEIAILRKFLMIVTVWGGIVSLTAIKNKKDEPKKSYDFEEYCRALSEKFKTLDV